MSASERALELVNIAARAADSKNASDQVALDISERLPFSDAFLIVTGANERSVSAIADEVEKQLYLAGAKLKGREGKEEGRWILLDFGEIMIHVFHEEERLYYGLERLWNDSPVIELPKFEGVAADGGAADSLGDD